MFQSLDGMLQRRLLLVYCLSPTTRPGRVRETSSPEVHWTWANVENVHAHFTENPRRDAFLKFLAKGFTGLILHRDEMWMAYAWMTTPATVGPPHLPRWIGNMNAHWIFYCRTVEAFRGQGLYKLALQVLVNRASERPDATSVMIDTSPGNIASRRAIVSTGFHPKGAILVYQLKIPRVGQWIWGTWRSGFVHPPLLPRAHGAGRD